MASQAPILSRVGGTKREYPGRRRWIMRAAIAVFGVAWLSAAASATGAGYLVGASLTTGAVLYGVGVALSTPATTDAAACPDCDTPLKPTDDRCSFCGHEL